MSQPTRKFEVSEGVVSALLGYLGQRPHNEVFQLMQALREEIRAQLTPAELGQTSPAAPVQEAS